jgi:hypothetical protein
MRRLRRTLARTGALVILGVIFGAFIWFTNVLSDLDHQNFILRTNQSSHGTDETESIFARNSAGLPVKFDTQDGLSGGAIIIVLGAIVLACTRKKKSIRGTEGDITKGMVVCGCLGHLLGCPTRQSLSSYFTEEELRSLGDLAHHVKVVVAYWRMMPSNLHGTSAVVNGVPVAIINPLLSALDKRYVILHELMHHQLDELGCPSLCCQWKTDLIPEGSWLRRVHFYTVVTRLVLHLWELIQHSRFNPMLKRAFKSGPESVRDSEYREYMSWRKSIPYYDMCGSDGHASVKSVAIAAHVATVILEGSIELRIEFIKFVRSRYPTGDDMVGS